MDTRTFAYRCSACDVTWPFADRYKVCPICEDVTWRLQIESVDKQFQTTIQADTYAAEIRSERALAEKDKQLQADIAAAHNIGRRATVYQLIRFRQKLQAEPVANRFAIPPEERCPEYEARDNPYPKNPWRPPTEAQDVNE